MTGRPSDGWHGRRGRPGAPKQGSYFSAKEAVSLFNALRGGNVASTFTAAKIGNTVGGNAVVANPGLTFNQVGFSVGGPIVQDELFFFVNGELSRRDDPGTNFAADTGGTVNFGETRVQAADLDAISRRLAEVYGYDTGAYDAFIHETDNDKLLVKLDWNPNTNNNLQFRWNYLDAFRDLPVNPAATSPLTLVGFDEAGEPVFDFTGPA